jgi:catechol 2,3-dioxygenase-like lactoylglutathione lyase family enzyme
MDASDNAAADRAPSVLSLKYYSHATLECKDITATRRFFEQFLGFETVLTSPISFWARLGGEHVIVVVQGASENEGMPFLNHNGLDVATDAEVDAAYETTIHEAGAWGLGKITKPRVMHGTYSFYFWDLDGNAWEVLSNPKGGYAWAFELGDQAGKGHLDKNFTRPVLTSDS